MRHQFPFGCCRVNPRSCAGSLEKWVGLRLVWPRKFEHQRSFPIALKCNLKPGSKNCKVLAKCLRGHSVLSGGSTKFMCLSTVWPRNGMQRIFPKKPKFSGVTAQFQQKKHFFLTPSWGHIVHGRIFPPNFPCRVKVTSRPYSTGAILSGRGVTQFSPL